MERHIIDYEPALKITNVEQLPRGTGCKYLVVVDSIYYGEYIAKAWKRNMPVHTARGESVIRF